MRSQYGILALIGVTAIACGPAGQERIVSLDFRPAAMHGGGFGAGVTTFNGDDACDLPDEIETFVIHTYSEQLTEAPAARYDAGDLGSDCTLSLLLPDDTALELVVEAFDSDENLRRKGMASFAVDSSADSVQNEPLVMWPAHRVFDKAAGDGSPDLRWIDVLRQFDAFLFELSFDGDAAPDTAAAAASVRGFMALSGEAEWVLLLDSHEDGMVLYDQAAPGEGKRVPFSFVPAAQSLRIHVPYARLGGEAGGDAIDAPDVELAVTLLDDDDAVQDELPGNGASAAIR